MRSRFVQLDAIGKSSLQEEQVDGIGLKDNEALIKAEYSLISAGTELSRAYGLKKGFSYPVRPGYCLVGRILEKGKDIRAEKGELVYANAPHGSLVRWSDSGKTQGPMIMRLPQDIDPLCASIINLVLVSLQGVNSTKVRIGDRVAVFGLGSIGIITALLYQLMGCEVLGLDPVVERCELAQSLGLKKTSHSALQQEVIDGFTNGEKADITVDVTGLSPVIIEAVKATRNYGQVLLLGSPRQSHECDVTPLLSAIHMKDLQVIGGFNQTVPVYPVEGSSQSVKRNFDLACKLIMDGRLPIRKLIGKVIDPKDCEKAYYELMYEKGNGALIAYDWRAY